MNYDLGADKIGAEVLCRFISGSASSFGTHSFEVHHRKEIPVNKHLKDKKTPAGPGTLYFTPPGVPSKPSNLFVHL